MRFRFDWLILLVGLGGTFGCGSGRVDPPPFVRQGVQLTIAPDPVTRLVGENQQFTCGAFFNDGTNGDATNLAVATQALLTRLDWSFTGKNSSFAIAARTSFGFST